MSWNFGVVALLVCRLLGYRFIVGDLICGVYMFIIYNLIGVGVCVEVVF